MRACQSIWVFGYGSLIWDPGFAFSNRALARLEGFRRSFCMRSIHHRGTVQNPGLVLALDQGHGFCDGVAFEIPSRIADESLEYLRARELISAAYLEKTAPVVLHDGRSIDAVTYIIDRDHEQYCAGLSLEDQAQIIAKATGGRGPNADYLFNTAAHLTDLGLEDPDLNWLANRVRGLQSAPRQNA
ncbi:MAG: gamma-glutamylcyclotransferase [Roseinatronobacter sp.]